MNAVLVLILVSIVVAALIAQRVVAALPCDAGLQAAARRQGARRDLVDGAVGRGRARGDALARPDGGTATSSSRGPPRSRARIPTVLRALEKRISSHGFDGHVRTEIGHLPDAVRHALLDGGAVARDRGRRRASTRRPGAVPLLVVGTDGAPRMIADGDESNGVAAEIERRLAQGAAKPLRIPRRTPAGR